MKKPIYTYVANLPGNNPEHETKLLLLWKRNWQRAGWEPIVLNEYIASEHPLFKPFNQRIAELPTVNPPGYERACYLRWMAMAQVDGGLMSDHDVFCYDQKFSPGQASDKVVSFQQHVPCLVWGTKSAYEKVVLQMLDYKVTEKDLVDGRQTPHVSDMYMFYRGGIEYTGRDRVKMFKEPGWDKAALVHYSTASMKAANYWPRHHCIPELRRWA